MTIAEPERKTRFPELVVSGTPEQMGSAIGEEFRNSIRDMSEMLLDRFNKGSAKPISQAEADNVAAAAVPFAEQYLPDAVSELRSTAKAAQLPFERLMLINVRSMLSAPEGCTSIMVGEQASASGMGMAGQNWDNDPAMDPFSAVITRRPSGKPAHMTWCQPGVIAYIGMSNAGVGVCMNALNGPSRRRGVGWYFIVRSTLEATEMQALVSKVRSAPRAMTANAAMITPQGPADMEITLDSVELLTAAADETMVHTNHCVSENLLPYNEKHSDAIYGQSFDRKARAEKLLGDVDEGGERKSVSLDDVKAILSDREGYPTSINRYPNDDPKTGWQRSVVSVVMEPDAGKMHVSRGNPGDNPYEVYELA